MGDLDKLYYVNVGKKGTFHNSGNPQTDTTAADIDKIFQNLKDNNQKKILLYFHGGLVKGKQGMLIADRVLRYTNQTNAKAHPVSFVWETGLLETIAQNLDTISKSSFFKKLLIKIIKVAGRELGVDVKGILAGSKGVGSMTDEEIRNELEKPAPFDQTIEVAGKRSVILNQLPPELQSETYYENVLEPEVREQLMEEISNDPGLIQLANEEKPREEASLMKNTIAENSVQGEKGILSLSKLISAAVKITIAVIKRHMKKRDHDFYPTIVEEIFREIYINDLGSLIWGLMKSKAKGIWEKDDFDGNPEDWHTGSYFLKKLLEYQQEQGQLTIDLVGHSAGAIVICELVDALSKRNIPIRFRNIFFMAPACRCELFSSALLRNKERFQQFRIFTMSDEYEKKDHLASFIYPRSLLYFISGVLEGDEYDAWILGMERHISGKKPYDREATLEEIKTFLLEDNHIVYAVTKEGAEEGFISGSRHHGDFDNEHETTLDSIFSLIKK